MNEAEQISIWFDDEGDYLTVNWGFKKGYYTDTEDDRVLVRVNMEGNVQGFQVEGISSLKDKRLVVRHSMDWWDRLGKDKRGSRPRCVLLTDGNREKVSQRLTQQVDLPDVVVSHNDNWMPYGKPVKREGGSWDKKAADEAKLDKADKLLAPETQRELRDWWLAVPRGANTPNWDIASTCTIMGKPGLLLVEAKAHVKELSESDKCGSTNPLNREQIGRAIAGAAAGLESATGKPWELSRDDHYQLSNRFAWSWKLASLGVPVVLVYLGFLNAQDMTGKGPLFHSPEDWERSVRDYGAGVVDNGCWGERLDISGVPFFPLIRTCEQPFNP